MTHIEQLRAELGKVQIALDLLTYGKDTSVTPTVAAARGGLAALWTEVLDTRADKVARSVDTACMDEIAANLDGTYWDCDTPVLIADIVRRSGREVRPPPEEETYGQQPGCGN